MQLFLSFLVAVVVGLVASTSVEMRASEQGTKNFDNMMARFIAKHNKGVQHRQSTVEKEGSKESNLRSESSSIALESSKQKVRMNGWFETVVYSNTWYKNCKHPWFKDVGILNTCGLSSDGTSYTSLSTVAYPDWNYYSFTQNLFSDSSCTQPITSYSVNYPILICTQDAYYHVIPQPLNPYTDNMNGFTYGVYNNDANCQTGTSEGVLEAFYFRLNYCYAGDASDGTPDVQWTSCSNGAGTLTQVTYNSYDGTCSGGIQSTDTWSKTNTCGDQQQGGFWFSGPTSFFCAN